jgi:hypothetical protein
VASRWLRSRGLDPATCAPLCRVLESSWPAWARSGEPPTPWIGKGYRLLLPVYDAMGELRSLRARAIRTDARPKELPPLGCRAAGYVFANRAAREALLSMAKCPRDFLIVEGTPDYMTWASRLPAAIDSTRPLGWAVIGLPGSGAWTRELADRIQDGSTVVIRTDPDDAGDRYAAIITDHLAGRCRVLCTDIAGRAARRAACASAAREGRPPGSGVRGRDENDLLRGGMLPADPRVGASAPP